jgi:hypothetical protein
MENKHSSQTILSIVVGFVAFGLLFKLHILIQAAFVIGFIALISEQFSNFVSKIWLRFAQLLGRVNGYILLTIIFFIFLTPIALLMKIIQKKDHLKLKKQSADSVYETRNHTYLAKDMANIW